MSRIVLILWRPADFFPPSLTIASFGWNLKKNYSTLDQLIWSGVLHTVQASSVVVLKANARISFTVVTEFP